MVLVVDNSANDHEANVLSRKLQQLLNIGTDFSMQILNPQRNLGFSHGVNAGLNATQAQPYDIFLLINNDTTVMPGAVKKMIEFIKNGHANIVVPIVLAPDGTTQPTYWYQRFLGLMTTFAIPGAFTFPSGCCMMLHNSLLIDGKLFSEDFFMYGEDVLLGWQLLIAGQTINSVDGAVVIHQGRGSSGNRGLFYEYHSARAHVLLALKTYHFWLEIPILIASKGLGLFLRALWRSLNFRQPLPLLAFLLAWLPLDIRPDHEKRSP